MKLRTYLDEREIPVSVFADRVSITPAALYRYLSGDRRPHRDVLLRIEAETQGSVRANDFFAADAA